MTINLIIPMAGKGHRFTQEGYQLPKPLLNLNGHPFFWWAIESVRKSFDSINIICVVLEEHVQKFNFDEKIKQYYPEAKICVIQNITEGALQTAMIGVDIIDNDMPIIINDCDHAFEKNDIQEHMNNIFYHKNAVAGLCHFTSNSPIYSYARYNIDNYLVETVEKKVISNLAIAGAYIFKSKKILVDSYEEYESSCPYNELFISGLLNILVDKKLLVSPLILDKHISFGTPSEYKLAVKSEFFDNWIN